MKKTFKLFRCDCGAKGNNIKGHTNEFPESENGRTCPTCGSEYFDQVERTFDFLRVCEKEEGKDVSYIDALEAAHVSPSPIGCGIGPSKPEDMAAGKSAYINSFGE